jgi:hypothetical protein
MTFAACLQAVAGGMQRRATDSEWRKFIGYTKPQLQAAAKKSANGRRTWRDGFKQPEPAAMEHAWKER